MKNSPQHAAGLPMACVLALGFLTLPGCMAIQSAPQPLDSPLPQLVTTPPPCALPNNRLAENERCFVIVQSENHFSRTGLAVKQGERYRITVPGTQFWFDKDRRVPAPPGDQGSPLISHASAFKRHPSANWFALMATTSKNSAQAQNIGLQEIFEATENGELILYPNDASFTYGNNHGRIMAIIQRCTGEPACVIK